MGLGFFLGLWFWLGLQGSRLSQLVSVLREGQLSLVPFFKALFRRIQIL